MIVKWTVVVGDCKVNSIEGVDFSVYIARQIIKMILQETKQKKNAHHQQQQYWSWMFALGIERIADKMFEASSLLRWVNANAYTENENARPIFIRCDDTCGMFD